MNRNSSSHTGRAHRSMQSAFGPYTNHEISPQRDRTGERIYLIVLVIVLCIVASALLTHYLAKGST